MALKCAEMATGVLAAGIADSDVALALSSGGSKFSTLGAGDYMYLRLCDRGLTRWEIVKCETHAVGSNDFTSLTRNVRSSTGAAQAWNADDLVGQVFPGLGVEEILAALDGKAASDHTTPAATTATPGHSELADQTETDDRSDTVRTVSPGGMAHFLTGYAFQDYNGGSPSNITPAKPDIQFIEVQCTFNGSSSATPAYSVTFPHALTTAYACGVMFTARSGLTAAQSAGNIIFADPASLTTTGVFCYGESGDTTPPGNGSYVKGLLIVFGSK